MRLAPVATLALACLAGGCGAMSVSELQESAIYRRAESTRPPDQAAGCIARRLESTWQGMTPSVRAAEFTGAWEVVLRTPDAFASYAVYALLRPSGKGSSIELWLTSMRIGGERAADETINGCLK